MKEKLILIVTSLLLGGILLLWAERKMNRPVKDQDPEEEDEED